MAEKDPLSALEHLERERNRLIEEAAAKASEASLAAAKATQLEAAMAELRRAQQAVAELAAGLNVTPAPAPAPELSNQAPQPEIPERQTPAFDGTIRDLAARYRASTSFTDLRFRTRRTYEGNLRRIERDMGAEKVAHLDRSRVLQQFEAWNATGKLSISRARIAILRILSTFGMIELNDHDCRELKFTLSNMEFPLPKPRTEKLTAQHANAIRTMAHEMGWPSVARAQAFQFDLMLQQKDVIGEWVPNEEDGFSEILSGGKKWLRGIRWHEIKKDPEGGLVLEHTTSSKGKVVKMSLSGADMVLDELRRYGERPTSKEPVIICEKRGLPWEDDEYRRIWRKIADAAGVPPNVRSMDSRSAVRDGRLLNRREMEMAVKGKKPA